MKIIKRTIFDNVPVGLYLVTFESIWDSKCNEGKHECCFEHGCGDNEPSYIAEIIPTVVKVTAKNYLVLGEDVIGKDDSFNSKELFEGDTHDIRPRLFKTLKEAKAHIKYTVDRFNNPSPWECFVKSA